MEWIREERPCPVCDHETFHNVGTRGGASHRDGLGEETNIVECAACSALYARPTMIPVGNPYDAESDYFAVHNFEDVRAAAHRTLDKVERWRGKGRILELGCGRAILLMVAKERGWDVKGVEMTQQFADEALENGVPVEVAKVEDCEALYSQYDVILLSAILEHLYRPVEVLRRISGALVPGGLLYIEIPNEKSLSFAVGNRYVRPWSMNLSPTFAPYHVVGFSKKSIAKALDLAGLRVKELRTMKYTNVLPAQTIKRKIEKAALGAIQHVGQWTGNGDGLVVWAEKPGG